MLLSREFPHFEFDANITDVPGLIYVNKAKTVVGLDLPLDKHCFYSVHSP